MATPSPSDFDFSLSSLPVLRKLSTSFVQPFPLPASSMTSPLSTGLASALLTTALQAAQAPAVAPASAALEDGRPGTLTTLVPPPGSLLQTHP